MSMRVPPQDDPPSPPLHKEIILMYNAKFHFHSLSSTLEDILRVGGTRFGWPSSPIFSSK